MVLQALSDLYLAVCTMLIGIYGELKQNMELDTCNLSSMKKVVFGHLLKRSLSLHFLCSLMGVRMYFYRAEYTIRPYFSPVRQPNQLTWRKQKLVFNYQTAGNFSSLSFFFFFGNFHDPPTVFKNSNHHRPSP